MVGSGRTTGDKLGRETEFGRPSIRRGALFIIRIAATHDCVGRNPRRWAELTRIRRVVNRKRRQFEVNFIWLGKQDSNSEAFG
jgi:hypothetical protein